MNPEKFQYPGLACLIVSVAIFLFVAPLSLVGQDKADDTKSGEKEKKEKVAAEKVTGKLLVINKMKLDVAFDKAEFILEEQFSPKQPPLPDNWKELKPEEQQKWATEFLATAEGKEYEKKENERFQKRRILEIIIDDQGGFSLEKVPYGSYFLQGRLGAKLEKRRYEAEVYASIKVENDVDHVDLGELEVFLLPRIENGDDAPDFTLDAIEGNNKITLSKFSGKYVLIDFWATTCGPCIMATPEIQKIYEKYGRDKLEVIGISLDEDKELALEYSKKKDIKWAQAFAGSEIASPKANPALNGYGVQGIPSFWLIGPDGKVVANDIEFIKSFEKNLDLEAVLKKHIK